jgi:MerR family mercuric resistance operon transcriptional regulator
MSKPSNDRITRGMLASQSGVNGETIRYYEKIKLMPMPMRSVGGHRLYDEEQLKRLLFIRRCRELGFRLEEIRNLLSLVDTGEYSCDDIRVQTEQHLQDVQQKARDLKKMESMLKKLIAECRSGKLSGCPLVKALYN